MTIYLFSDTHFFHDKIAQLRGFSNYKQHDEQLILNINKRVNANDDLYLLGDIVMASNGKTWSDNLSIVNRLNGHKHLIVGNHDRCAPNNKNGHKHKEVFLQYFDTVSEYAEISYKGITFMLSHYPYDETDDGFVGAAANASEYEQYQLRDSGTPVIHGHTHSEQLLTHSRLGTPQINVNAESTNLKPVIINDVLKLIQ